MAYLELQGINKRFGEITALRDVSLGVERGEFAILLGPSGCGKSTLLRIIAGLEAQTEGAVLFEGKPVDELSPRDRDVAMVFQSYALYPHLNVQENLAFGLKMRKEKPEIIDERIREAAQLLGIGDLLGRKPRQLSGGQRQRVAMGRALVRHPRLFLFDEPLSNLDARLRVAMRAELKQLHRRLQSTMVYVTHDQVEAMTLGDKIVVMDKGRIRQADTADRIYHAPADTFVAGFIGSPGMNLFDGTLRRDQSAWVFSSDRNRLQLPPMREEILAPAGRTAVLGVRPEDVAVTPPQEPSLSLRGKVELVEDLGAERLIHVTSGDWEVVARIPRSDRKFGEGEMTLYLPKSRIHLFLDGQRVEPFE